MFNSLKQKLKGLKTHFGSAIDTQAGDADTAQVETTKTKPKKETVGIGQKAKSLILNREFVIDAKSLTEPLWDLEVALLESDVALAVCEEIVSQVRSELLGSSYKIGASKDSIVEQALRNALINVLNVGGADFDELVRSSKKPVNIVFVGVNGTGKTTTISKIARRLMNGGYSVVIAAGDTFRAGAIAQLQRHADNLGVKMIKHQEGGDPAAVVYDAVSYARARNVDAVLADTAGRMHTNINLMDQLKKICRVAPPDMVIFVDEAIAGNDAVERANLFNQAVPITGSILTKTDADSKGGAAISIAYSTGKPIFFLGVGQEYDDMIKFEPQWLVDRLFE